MNRHSLIHENVRWPKCGIKISMKPQVYSHDKLINGLLIWFIEYRHNWPFLYFQYLTSDMKCYEVNPFIFSFFWDDPFVSKGLQTLLLWWKLSLLWSWDGLTPLFCWWHSQVMIPRYTGIRIKEIRYFTNFNREWQIKADCCILCYEISNVYMKLKWFQIKECEKIVVIGGGATGVELSAELATGYPDKEITLIHSREYLVGDQFSEKFQNKLKDILRRKKINVLLGKTW